jgi:haloalkane dehalogenase
MTVSAASTTPNWLDREAYPFRSRWTHSAGSRLHYVDEGNGDAVLFVHGTPTWSFEFRHLITALAPTYRCIALDHLGFGLSDRPRRVDYSPKAHAERLAFVSDLHLDRFTLVVHDYGGPIGLPLAFSTPSPVQRLVLITGNHSSQPPRCAASPPLVIGRTRKNPPRLLTR